MRNMQGSDFITSFPFPAFPSLLLLQAQNNFGISSFNANLHLIASNFDAEKASRCAFNAYRCQTSVSHDTAWTQLSISFNIVAIANSYRLETMKKRAVSVGRQTYLQLFRSRSDSPTSPRCSWWVTFHCPQEQKNVFRCLSSLSRQSEQQEKLELALEREALLSQAQQLTICLYRHCMRSVKSIRHGNDHDELEFQERERQREASMEAAHDPRLSMLSMLPPVNRKDELRSRAEYYQQHANEMFTQESDCLTFPSVMEKANLKRYLHHLRQGEYRRTYLLRDMKFADPINGESVDQWKGSVLQWQNRAELYCARKDKNPTGAAAKALEESSSDDDDDDGFWTDSDEED